MPKVYFGNTDEMNFLRSVVYVLFHRDVIKINSVRYLDGGSSKYRFVIGEGDDSIHVFGKSLPEALVNK